MRPTSSSSTTSLNLSGAKELLAPVLRGAIDVLGNVKDASARIADLEKRGLVGAEDENRDPSVLDALILLLIEIEKLGEDNTAQDEAPFEESKHPRDAKGEFASKGNEGAGGESGEEEKNPDGKKVSTSDIVEKAGALAAENGMGLGDLSPLQSAQHKYNAAIQLGSNYASATWATTTDEDDALKQVYGSTEDAWKALAEKAKNPGGTGFQGPFATEMAKIDNAEGKYGDLDTNLKSAEAKVKVALEHDATKDDLVPLLTNSEHAALMEKHGSTKGAMENLGGEAEMGAMGGKPFEDAVTKIDDTAGIGTSLDAAELKAKAAVEHGATLKEFEDSLSPFEKEQVLNKHGSLSDALMAAAASSEEKAAASSAPAKTEGKTKFGGLWKTQAGNDENGNIMFNAGFWTQKPTNAGSSYRSMLAYLIKNGPAAGLDAGDVDQLKVKLVEALYKANDKAVAFGKEDEVKKLYSALAKIKAASPGIFEAGLKAFESGKAGKPAPVYKPPVTAAIAAQALKENPKMAAVVAQTTPKTMSDIQKYTPAFAEKLKQIAGAYPVASINSSSAKIIAALENNATLSALEVALKPAEKAKLEKKYGSLGTAWEKYNKWYGPNSPNGKAKAAAAAQAQMPIAENAAKPTDAELTKAKKTAPLQLQYVPNAPAGSAEAQKMVDEFNAKWSGKEVSDADALKKIADFKAMAEKMKPLMSEAQKKAAEQNAKIAAEAAKSQAQQAAQAKADAEKHGAELAEYKKELGISDVEAQGFEGLLSLLGTKKADLINEFKKSDVQAGHGITKFEGALIARYKSSSDIVNKEMRKPEASWTVPQVMFAKVLNKALGKLPGYKGETIRNTPLSSDLQMRYKPGNIVFEHGFTGTSKQKPNGIFSGNTRFYVTGIGKRGGDIADMHGFGGEQEVLYQAHTMFHVDKVEGQVGGKGEASYKVWMTEVEM